MRELRTILRVQANRGVSLIELLVVIAIIGILTGLALMGVQAAREAGRRTQCANNLRQVSLATLNYESAHQTLPPAAVDSNQLSWCVLILPYIEQVALDEKISRETDNWRLKGRNEAVKGVFIPGFQCPAAPEDSLFSKYPVDYPDRPDLEEHDVRSIHYHGVLGPMGMNVQNTQPYEFHANPLPPEVTSGPIPERTFRHIAAQGAFGIMRRGGPGAEHYLIPIGCKTADITDGTSQTLLLGEMSWPGYRQWRSWLQGWFAVNVDGTLLHACKNVRLPINSKSGVWHDAAFGSQHSGGAQFGRCDGSTQFLSTTIDMSVYRALASRNGGEVVGEQP